MQYPWSVSWRRFMEAYHRYSKSNLPLPLYLHSAEGRCARLILGARYTLQRFFIARALAR